MRGTLKYFTPMFRSQVPKKRVLEAKSTATLAALQMNRNTVATQFEVWDSVHNTRNNKIFIAFNWMLTSEERAAARAPAAFSDCPGGRRGSKWQIICTHPSASVDEPFSWVILCSVPSKALAWDKTSIQYTSTAWCMLWNNILKWYQKMGKGGVYCYAHETGGKSWAIAKRQLVCSLHGKGKILKVHLPDTSLV